MNLPPIRRVVTGDDAHGVSSIVADGPSPAVRLVPERPGYRVTNLWCTQASPSSVHAPDRIAEHQGVAPPPGGTVLRIIDVEDGQVIAIPEHWEAIPIKRLSQVKRGASPRPIDNPIYFDENGKELIGYGYKYGFLAAAIGMALGQIIFNLLSKKYFPSSNFTSFGKIQSPFSVLKVGWQTIPWVKRF